MSGPWLSLVLGHLLSGQGAQAAEDAKEGTGHGHGEEDATQRHLMLQQKTKQFTKRLTSSEAWANSMS